MAQSHIELRPAAWSHRNTSGESVATVSSRVPFRRVMRGLMRTSGFPEVERVGLTIWKATAICCAGVKIASRAGVISVSPIA